MSLINCPCCNQNTKKRIFSTRGKYTFFQCSNCTSIFIDPFYIKEIDAGKGLLDYDYKYWEREVISSKKRSFGPALARMSEVLFYCRRPIKCFIDIGSGPGLFLDAVRTYLPENADIFHAYEKYPPPGALQTKEKNYYNGHLEDINKKADAGLCMEVIEHMTPNMLKKLLASIKRISNNNSIYLFNSGQPEYVIKEDPNYLDGNKRGHIIAYSLQAIKHLSSEFNFTINPLEGKTWAFIMEYNASPDNKMLLKERIWSALPENIAILESKSMGSVLKILGLESARAY